MLITCIISIVLFIVSVLASYIWLAFLSPINLLFLPPVILVIFISLYLAELYLVPKYKLNRTVYNVITIQIPAIASILLALILWVIHLDPLVIRTFLSAGKYILIPIMILRLFVEFLYQRKTSLIVSMGLTTGLIIGFLIIRTT